MTDELLLALSDMADISPKKVRLIVNAYEKAKPGDKLIPEGYTTFKYAGDYYAYKPLGDGLWTPQCASLKLMKVLKSYFISTGKMEKGGHWPDSTNHWAWTSDVDSNGCHYCLYSDGDTNYGYDIEGDLYARFAVLPQDSENKMEKGGHWPDSTNHWSWTSGGHSNDRHTVLYSGGNTCSVHDDCIHARFAVLPQDSENKKFIKEASHENETL